MQKLVYLIACILLSSAVWAQQKTVSGIVTDNNNVAVAGASVAGASVAAGASV